MALNELLPGRGHGQFAMLDAFGTDQTVSHDPDIASCALDHEHFQAVIVIEMDVQGREDELVVVVLDAGEFFREVADSLGSALIVPVCAQLVEVF